MARGRWAVRRVAVMGGCMVVWMEAACCGLSRRKTQIGRLASDRFAPILIVRFVPQTAVRGEESEREIR